MMTKFSTSRHRRHHSWPPFQLHSFTHNTTIDENPFAFFLSASDDLDDFSDEHIRADIDQRPRSRSLSPFVFRKAKDNRTFEISSTTAISKLKRWIEKMERRYFHRRHVLLPQPEFKVSPTKAPQNSPSSPQMRGRMNARTRPNSRANRAMRSHSGRPRIWREPDEDIWTVMEEQEEIGLGITNSWAK